MNPEKRDPEQDILDFLDRRDFVWQGEWIFTKNGIKYDLSAANIMLIDEIESKGIFIVKENENESG